MNKPLSVDFQFSVEQRGRGAKKRIVESNGESNEPNKALERIPRISRYMALAIHFEDLIRRGIVLDYADLARLGHVTRARVTQIMNLRLLPPEIQEHILHYDSVPKNADRIDLKSLQLLIAELDWSRQRKAWDALIRKTP